MIDAGLHKILAQLEEIGSTASKEYALEMSMAKMKSEWKVDWTRFVPGKRF